LSRDIPDRIRYGIEPTHSVIWWGRRAGLEIVEEVSRATFSSLVILFIAVHLDQALGLSEFAAFYWVGVALAMTWASGIAIVEILEWRNEIYVVSQNDNDRGGRLYKFHGYISHRKISESITQQSPTVITTIPMSYRIWKFFTNQKIINFSVKTSNHTFLDGRRISNQFEWALIMVRGNNPKDASKDGAGFQGVDGLIKLRMMGGLSDREFKDASRTVVYRELNKS